MISYIENDIDIGDSRLLLYEENFTDFFSHGSCEFFIGVEKLMQR